MKKHSNQNQKEVVGLMFIHMFKGNLMTTKPRPHSPDYDGKPKKKEILMFMLLGERSIIQFIETRISTITVQCPLNKLLRMGA